ncbi:zinc-binding alcohol dehydrogenase family protein [Thermosporothrix hazakensis]|uniref:Zinc-binding alcohol dehydrogenase family protein n=1 Tax=Thermosporothrix hazakensis TaxID=644383 RepID=A0A326U3S4_THEHA|nr:zinc-binding dehydrogenase [Thermosporothrix hazakensis]PZW27104.1 zinc-binding alcohol dehydrogenase family protein [Thermosporothrix hazakensis]GCE50387.1 hypothetical protein KTH_52560 [Thermosporothrix hazakensis]
MGEELLYGKLQAGQRVLVLGAAGGVGSFGVQLAHLKGAYVLATASSENQDYVRSLGADEVIDYTKVPPEEITGSITDAVDLIFDAVGGKTAEQSVRVLRRGGTLISAVSQPAPELMEEHGTQGIFFLATITSEILQAIAALIDEGSVQTPRTTVFPLQEVQQAHGGGRIVLQIADEHALSRDVEQE